MSLVDRPYPELTLNRAASSRVHEALQIPLWRNLRGVHLLCGSAYITGNFEGQRSCSWQGIDPDPQLISKAKARPSVNSVGKLEQIGNFLELVNHPLRRDYHFRCEPITDTSVKTRSVHRVVFEWGIRGDVNPYALADEICRIAVPGAIVIVLVYRIPEVECWGVNDVLSPMLRNLRKRCARPASRAFARFGFVRASVNTGMSAEGRFDLADMIRHIDESPEALRLLAVRGWSGAALLHTRCKAVWGARTKRRNVRRSVEVWRGLVPGDPNERSSEIAHSEAGKA